MTDRAACPHFDGKVHEPLGDTCQECGSDFNLRVCTACGHVGCCDSSPGRHATKHFQHTTHPVMASYEPGERWAWCYVDEAEVDVPEEVTPYLR